MGSATSFSVCTAQPGRIGRAVEAAIARVQQPAAGLIFLTGALADKLPLVAEALRVRRLGVPLLLGVGAGVSDEHSEIEGQAAAAGLIWSGPQGRVLAIDRSHCSLADLLDDSIKQTDATTLFALLRPGRFESGVISPLGSAGHTIFGGGVTSENDVYAVDPRGAVSQGSFGALLYSGTPPLLGVTRASRLLTPLRPITRVRGSMVLEIDGEEALDVLSTAGQDIEGEPLILAALSSDEMLAEGAPARTPELLLRPIQGVDPSRRGVLLGEELQESTHLAFAVRDSAAARADLEAMTREMVRDVAGAAPRFAVYVNCAGRGSNLHATPNVDIRILRARLGSIPIVGFQSAFELAPYGDDLALHLYSGVLALFTSPS